MVFSSTVFLFLFLPIVLILYFNPFVRSRKYRNMVLLLTSLLFYAWGEPVFVFVMLLSIAANWRLAIWIDRADGRRKRTIVTAAVLLDLGLLFVFKYLTFVSENIGLLIGREDFVFHIALPIGISFFTFQILSYVLDVYYGNARVQENVLDVALYIAMFPQLIAGPIVRYSVVADEIHTRKECAEQYTKGFSRFVYGLAKKVLLANYLAILVDNIFLLEQKSVATAWLGIIAYALQIYYDFSGYSDMAIGLGLVFGFHFNENFQYPYISKSIPEFWRRWHISVSEWFRDYLFYPVMRSGWCGRLAQACRKRLPKAAAKNVPTVVATLIVWSATGIWHGADWTFLLWGLYYGILISLSIVVKKPMKNWNQKLHISEGGWFDAVRLARTLFLVCIGYVLFRSDGIGEAVQYLAAMFGAGAPCFIDDVFWDCMESAKMILAIAVVSSMPLVPWLRSHVRMPEQVKELIGTACMAGLFVLSVLACIKSTYNPFIYFNF